jgi:hydrogenase nickel incorporation protein HypB
MSKVRTITINENVYAQNDQQANNIRAILKNKKVFMVNVMSSPGSGKTCLLENLINKLKDKYRIGEMDVDITSSLDADKVYSSTGIKCMQINNGGLCHIDADMTLKAINEFNIDNLDLLFLENIGNLVCPAEFDTGASKNMMILSVPEGDDKPLKYPLMFQVSDIVVISKIDTLPIFDFDIEKAKKYILNLNPHAKIVLVSSKTDVGMMDLVSLLEQEIQDWKKQ